MSSPDFGLIDAIERAGIEGWPPTTVRELNDGWILRATPGLARGRSNNALTPRTRPLERGELPMALERIRAWSALHAIRGGLQISPLELHSGVVPGLLAAGWQPDFSVWVMTAERAEVLRRAGDGPGAGVGVPWVCSRSPQRDWLTVWATCRGSREGIDAHVATVFANMADRGRFGRIGTVATGIVVEDHASEWAGLFSLVVDPAQRGRGLGRRLVFDLLGSLTAPRIYLQVDQQNAVALGLYASLGFQISHSYQHLHAPHGWATG